MSNDERSMRPEVIIFLGLVVAFVLGVCLWARDKNGYKKMPASQKAPARENAFTNTDADIGITFGQLGEGEGEATNVTSETSSTNFISETSSMNNEGGEAVSLVTVANKGQRERELMDQIKKLKNAKQ